MRAVLPWTIAAALTVVLPATARAQDPGPPPSQPVPGATSQTPPQNPSTTSTTTDDTASGWLSPTQSRWTAAGFVGANYGASATGSSVDFGGQLGYLYRGIIGGEFLADFAPRFNVANAFLADRPNVNAYMANVILAAPFGTEAAIQPYVSAGVGGIQLRSNMLTFANVPSERAKRSEPDARRRRRRLRRHGICRQRRHSRRRAVSSRVHQQHRDDDRVDGGGCVCTESAVWPRLLAREHRHRRALVTPGAESSHSDADLAAASCYRQASGSRGRRNAGRDSSVARQPGATPNPSLEPPAAPHPSQCLPATQSPPEGVRSPS